MYCLKVFALAPEEKKKKKKKKVFKPIAFHFAKISQFYNFSISVSFA